MAIYSSEHPDVVKLRKEIASLASQSTMATGDPVAIETELASARADLDAAQQRYSAEHPDVRKLTRKVDGLESRLKEIATPWPGRSNPSGGRITPRISGSKLGWKPQPAIFGR